MAFSTSLLFLFTLVSFNSLTTTVQQPAQPPAAAPASLMNAVETLSNAHYNAMALTLEVLLLNQPQSLIPFPGNPLSLTLFSPPDSAFISSGQPSLSLLLLHFSPLSFSQTALFSLPYYSPIPTLSPSHTPLYITTTTPPSSTSNSSEFSINGVKYSPLPLFDDGFVVVFGIDDFFNPNFTFLHPTPTINPDNPNPPVCNMEFTTTSRFLEPSSVLKSRGFTIMASFLDLQLIGFMGSSTDMKLTVFAPIDEALVEYSGNFLEYSSLFLRHLLPCKISWSDLIGIANGTTFDQGYLQGQGYNNSIKIEKLEDYTVMVNGVKITAPDMYKNESIVIHGLQQLIPVMNTVLDEEEQPEQISLVKLLKKPDNNMCIPPNNGEF